MRALGRGSTPSQPQNPGDFSALEYYPQLSTAIHSLLTSLGLKIPLHLRNSSYYCAPLINN
jgi:hypothetical protein